MPKIRFLDTDHYAGATLAATNEVAALPAAASQNTDRRFLFRSLTGTIAIDVDIDLGSVKTVDACAVANVTLFTGGALELYERGDAGSAGAASLVGTLSAEDADSRVAFLFPASSAHRHWQLKFTNPSPVSGFCEVGFVHLGTYSELSVNVSAPFTSTLRDQSVMRRSPSGGRSTSLQPTIRMVSWSIPDAPEADRVILDTLFRAVGTRVPVFVVLDTAKAWTALLLYFLSEIQVNFAQLDGRYDLIMDAEEAPA